MVQGNSEQVLLTKKLLDPSRVLGAERWFEGNTIVEQVVAAVFVTLVNQRLQLDDHVVVRGTQRHPDRGQSVTQPDGIGSVGKPPDGFDFTLAKSDS